MPVQPLAIYVEPNATIARKVIPHIHSAEFTVYDARDDAEFEGILARLAVEDAADGLHLFVVNVDRPSIRPRSKTYDLALLEALRKERANETFDGLRRLGAIPLIALTDDVTRSTKEAISKLDHSIHVLSRTPEADEMLTAIQRVLSEYRHELTLGRICLPLKQL